MRHSVCIIIVNYRTARLTLDCLASLARTYQEYPHFFVVIIDNNSGDDSVRILTDEVDKRQYQSWVVVQALADNNGFAAGNNAAIRKILSEDRYADVEYILLLNPDTVVHKDCVPYLVRCLEDNSSIGVVGAQLKNHDNCLEVTARRFPTPLGELISGARLKYITSLLSSYQVSMPCPKQRCRCDWVSGAAMMIRRAVLETVGFLDERYFLYFEEIDFCRRVTLAGWEVWIEPKALVTHFEGQATGIRSARQRRGRYWYESRRRFFIRHYGVAQWLLADLFWGLGRLSWRLRTLLRLGKDTGGDPLYFSRDLLLGDVQALLSGKAFAMKHDEVIS